ncbi:TadE/TadG family type IV pilus assembly protein [Planktotalea sp.]|uniref:TadE/TadG family type IV pilus assembly protein n=1 Tax=Planktotalea sp. TaxID=2029877 RepID=UPI003F6C68C0
MKNSVLTKHLILDKLRSFVSETKASASVEAAIIFPAVFWAYAAMFTYFEAFRAQAVAEKSAYAISDMISRETQPITPSYMTNARNIYKDLSGLSPGETALRVTLLRWDAQGSVFKVDWSKRRGDIPRLRTRDVTEYNTLLPTLIDNERIILVETASDYDPAFSVGLEPRVIETFVFTRPRYAPQIVWDQNG